MCFASLMSNTGAIFHYLKEQWTTLMAQDLGFFPTTKPRSYEIIYKLITITVTAHVYKDNSNISSK